MTILLSVDPYTRIMQESFSAGDYVKGSTGFLSFFGMSPGSKTTFSPNAEVLDIDMQEVTQRTAQLVPRKGAGTRSTGTTADTDIVTQFSGIGRQYPLIEQQGSLDRQQLLGRGMGENPYVVKDMRTRMRDRARELHKLQMLATVRAFERLAAQSVLTGKHDCDYFGQTVGQYDFFRPAGHTFAVPTAWDDTDPDIIGDIETACELGRKYGRMYDMMLLGEDVARVYFSDTVIKLFANSDYYKFVVAGRDNPVPPKFDRFVEGGMIPRGSVQTPKGFNLWVFTYLATYENESDVMTKYMPVDQVLIGDSQARCDRGFGPPTVLPMTAGEKAWMREMFGFGDMPIMPPNIQVKGDVLSPAMFHMDAYAAQNRKSVTIRTQSAPVFMSTDNKAFVLMTDVLV